MLDSAVKILSAQSAVGTDAKTLLPVDTVVVRYNVGQHGPFTITTPREQFTHDYLVEETGKTVNTLRQAGAIT